MDITLSLVINITRKTQAFCLGKSAFTWCLQLLLAIETLLSNFTRQINEKITSTCYTITSY